MSNTQKAKYDALKNYRDSEGYLDHQYPSRGKVSGNTLLYTSVFYFLVYELGEFWPDDRIEYQEVLKKSQADKGLYNRSVYLKGNLNKHDDYMGICMMLSRWLVLGNKKIAEEIQEWGKSHLKWGLFYSYNNSKPNDLTWDSCRLPQHQAVIDLAATGTCGLLGKLFFLVSLFFSGKAKHKDGNINTGVRCQGWIQLEVFAKYSGFFKMLRLPYIWYSSLEKNFSVYYGDTPWLVLFKEYVKKLKEKGNEKI